MCRFAYGGAEMSILELKNVCYTYGTGTPFEKKAVNDVSFSVNKGELIGIIGHTGSGKSTLVQMLNGLMKPTSGQVLLDGVDIWDKPKEIRKIRFKVGMVFQYPEYQLFEETVYKDIAFGPTNKGLSAEEIDKEVRRAARFTGLKGELLDKSPFDLSGGEKRRAAIAGVIAMDPDVLVLDEPTAGLDPMGRDVLLSQIIRYHKERQNTVLLVSHSMEDIARVADRIVVMNKSQLVMFDETQKIFARGDELEKIGLRIPQITKIMSQLRKRGVDVPEGILTVDAAVNYLLPLIKKEEKQW
jgi:energy-coupling factor transport system ATP-binding protein